MNIPVKKLTNGFELPVYGLGLWEMGGRKDRDTTNDEANLHAIDFAIRQGITHIDTAEVYGDGHAEDLLGVAIKKFDRSKLIIASKVAAFNQGYDGVMRACEASLNRIDTNYLDLYMLHRYPEPGIDIEGTMKALNELYSQGVVRNIGVSNMSPARFDKCQSLCDTKLVCNQVHYNVQYREVEEKGVLKQTQDNDVMLVAWRPVQKGAIPESEIIQQVATKYGKTPTQISINWLISQQNVVTIAKTTNKNHLLENLGAVEFVMDNEDIELIRNNFESKVMISDAVPLDYIADISP